MIKLIPILLCLLFTHSSLQAKPDMFFYLADDQNYWDYGFNGNEYVPTPNIDQLADESLIFDRAYTSMAICAPSRSSLYTGMYPMGTGCYMNHLPSRSGIQSIAQRMKDLGYTVILAGKSHVKPGSVYDWSYYWPSIKVKGEAKKHLPLKKVAEFLSEHKEPVCIFFASEFPHGPYPKVEPLKSSEFDPKPHQGAGQYALKRKAGYYENIRKDDIQVGQLIKVLKLVNRWDNSIFFYASDHGIDGKYTTYDRGLRVPLLLKWKDKVEAGKRNNALVHFIDIAPTMLEIAGAEPSGDLDGKSFLPLIEGKSEKTHDAVYGLQTYQNIQKTAVFPGRAITTDRYKLAVNFNSIEMLDQNLTENEIVSEFIERGAKLHQDRPYLELYDIIKDPFEQRNLAGESDYAEVLDTLKNQLFAWMKSQDDFIVPGEGIPLLKPTLHPLDENSRFKKVPGHLEGKLNASDYIEDHY